MCMGDAREVLSKALRRRRVSLTILLACENDDSDIENGSVNDGQSIESKKQTTITVKIWFPATFQL